MGWLAAALVPMSARPAGAQNLTLEGQTGGFITPTAYVVYSAEGRGLSHPAISYHFVDASKVIGNIHTFSIAEGFMNRAEVGYTRSVHTTGDSPEFSQLWHFAGMNIFSGKVVAIRDGQFGRYAPGVAAGVVVRTGDRFVSGAIDGQTYTNEDAYVAVTKTWLHPPLPLLVNLGWKATNASIYGIGGQATRFGGRLFGGVGFPLPGPRHIVFVPAVGFTQEPPQVKNLSALLVSPTGPPVPGAPAHIPTTIDYAMRVTQRDDPHFAFDIGVGHVAGVIGDTAAVVPGVGLVRAPVDLQASAVLGLGMSYRF